MHDIPPDGDRMKVAFEAITREHGPQVGARFRRWCEHPEEDFDSSEIRLFTQIFNAFIPVSEYS